MNYKRWTKRVGNGISIRETSFNDNKSIFNAIEHLAELEDEIEQGTLVDTSAFYIDKGENHGSGFPFVICKDFKEVHIYDFCFSREEAEEKIKELQDEMRKM